jgi:probable rRNA maturation factor
VISAEGLQPPGRGTILAPGTSRIIESDSGTAASLEFAAPRTMILLDPDLDPDAESHSGATSPHAAWRRSALPRAERLPTLRTLARFLAKAQAEVGLRGQVTVLLATDKTIRDLNHRFRGKNKTTDVLSFPATPIQNANPMERVAGDIAISVPTARLQGAGFGHTLGMELQVLMLHGLLHLAGYDHESDTGRMHRGERTLRKRLGLPLGLIERVSRKREAQQKTVILSELPRRQVDGLAVPKSDLAQAPSRARSAHASTQRGSRKEARRMASDGFRHEVRRTKSGVRTPQSTKPRRSGGNAASSSKRSHKQ